MQLPESLAKFGPSVFGLGLDRGRAELDDVGEHGSEDGFGDRAASNAGIDDLEGDCYFPKDGYNYEQHLKHVSGGKRGGVVGVVLDAPQKVDTEALHLQVAAGAEAAEALRALEHAGEYEEFTEEDIGEMLPGGAGDLDLVLWGPSAYEYQDLPDLADLRRAAGDLFAAGAEGAGGGAAPGHGGRARTASAEAEFDQFFADEYGDGEIGACDEDNIEGPASLEACGVLDDYLRGREEERDRFLSIYEPQRGRLDDVPRVIDETRAIIERHYSGKDGDGEETSSGEDDTRDESEAWDCETVLSTLSNMSNRPGKIGRVKVAGRPGQALQPVRESDGGDGKEGESGSEGVVELPDVSTSRPPGETPEERKLRKNSVKEMRRLCRKMKKESKELYKQEAQRLQLPGSRAAVDVRPRTRCVRL